MSNASAPPVVQTVAQPGQVVRTTRLATLALLAALVGLGAAWELWLAPTGRGTLALKVVPLLFAVPGLARLRMYTYRWLSLVVWLYVAEGLVRAGSESGMGRGLAVAEVVLGVLLFSACAWHVRWRLKHAVRISA